MADTVAIVPVKQFDYAKSRLRQELGEDFSIELVKAMVIDALEAIIDAKSISELLLITRESCLSELFGSHAKVEIISDDGCGSHSSAAMLGVAHAKRRDAQTIALLAGDCPMLTARQVDQLVSRHDSDRCITIAPDRHRTGTNALVLTPLDLIAPSFGHASFERHRQLALDIGVVPHIYEGQGLLHDVDTCSDLIHVRQAAHGRVAARTITYLNSHAFATV